MSDITTPLDQAQAAVDAAQGAETAQLAYYARLLDSELVVLLQSEPEGEQIEPRVFELQSGPVILAFDLAERLADFVGVAAVSAVLPGRKLIEMLAGQGIGLGINLEVAPSSTLLEASSIDWLAAMIEQSPEEVQQNITEFATPTGVPKELLQALDAKLARLEGLAESAYLVGALFQNGTRGHLLALIDPMPGAENVLARAVSEALMFSGVEAGAIHTAFFRASDPVSARLAKVGLRFDLPQLQVAEVQAPKTPGRDPNKPPILR